MQFLAPKLTTGSNHNYQLSSNKLITNNIDTIYSNMKSAGMKKSKRQIKMNHKNCNNSLNENMDSKYRTSTSFGGDDNNYILNGSFSKTMTKSKRKFDD